MSKDNQLCIYEHLKVRFGGGARLLQYMHEHLYDNMENFCDVVIMQEMMTSDPLPGITMLDQLQGFNAQFIKSEELLIRDHVIGMVEETPIYSVNDGISTTRYGLMHYQGKPDDILASWWLNAGRTAQPRDDMQGDLYPNNPYYNNSALGDTVGHHTSILPGRGKNPNCQIPVIERMGKSNKEPMLGNINVRMSGGTAYQGRNGNGTNNYASGYLVGSGPYISGLDQYGTHGPIYPFGTHDPTSNAGTRARIAYSSGRCPPSDSGMNTGIVFSDQSKFNTSNHVAMYENTSYKASLNSIDPPHTYSVIGDSTPASDARLMERRIFRSNYSIGNEKVENGIPWFQQKLHGRHLDRQDNEGFHNAEKECIQYRHDMDSLNARIDSKRLTRAKYDPTWPNCDAETTRAIKGMNLHSNQVKVTDDRYY